MATDYQAHEVISNLRALPRAVAYGEPIKAENGWWVNVYSTVDQTLLEEWFELCGGEILEILRAKLGYAVRYEVVI